MFNKMARHKFRWITALIVALIVIFGALELTNTTHIFKQEKPTASVGGGSFSIKGEPKNNSSSNTSGNSTGGGGSDQPSGSNSKSTGSAVNLITPFGDFVSNHHPNLSNSPTPNTESSVCNTAPGASCKITFSKDGVVKSLPAQTSDANGSAYWNWQLQSIGITEGTWNIQATASLNGQTKNASDSLSLVVSP